LARLLKDSFFLASSGLAQKRFAGNDNYSKIIGTVHPVMLDELAPYQWPATGMSVLAPQTKLYSASPALS
jgi:hypothetical protein